MIINSNGKLLKPHLWCKLHNKIISHSSKIRLVMNGKTQMPVGIREVL